MAPSIDCIFLLLCILIALVILLLNVNVLDSLNTKWKGIDILRLEDVPDLTVNEVDCHGLFANRADVVRQAEELQEKNMTPRVLNDHQVAEMAKNCEIYRINRGYILQPVSFEARDFPLAFSMIVYKDAEMVERLLRAIYRPQNYYCVHIDVKAKDDFKGALQSVVECFDNVFISRRSVDVRWSQISVLEAEMICLRELWKYKAWKYFINLTGQEFPIKTNQEIVDIMKAFGGANDIRVSLIRRWIKYRAKRYKKSPMPHGVHYGKGAAHVILSRAFVNFTLHDKAALNFYNWLNGTHYPDESYFSSLFISPALKVPGAYTGPLNVRYLGYNSVVRLKYWSHNHECSGRKSHGICIMTIYELPDMAEEKEIFVNKFHSGYQPLAYRCMEQLIAERVRAEVIAGKSAIDIDYYRKVPLVPHRQ